MNIFEKIFPYILPALESIVLVWFVFFIRRGGARQNHLKVFFFILSLQFLAHAFSTTRLGFQIHDQLGFHALPPYNQYFLTQAIGGVQTLAVGAIHAAIWLLILWYFFLYRGKGVLLDVVDAQLIILSLVAVGWPAGLVFLACNFALAVIGMIVLVVLRKKSLTDRLVITPYIIPAAILTLFLGHYVLAWTHLDKIRF